MKKIEDLKVGDYVSPDMFKGYIDIHKETGGAKELNIEVIEEDFWKHIPIDLRNKLKICKDTADPLLKDSQKMFAPKHFGVTFSFISPEERAIEFEKAIVKLAKATENQFQNLNEEILVLSPRMFDLLKQGDYHRTLITFYWFED